MKNNRVHVGFGFHVNCYHSYRGDSNDAAGFASDIKIIRHTIQKLDRWNASGVPVKGTWDFENVYSLEKILPEYAPDIITDVRRRCQDHGDENILMGYNNGAMSAMTKDEFLASVSLAIHNPEGSGLQDLFGSYAPVIRPQEVMFTPSEAALYQQAGIQAVCLYYSCVPFDAFRTILPQLKDEDAFNPLTYTWQGSSITILPTYSQSDVMDAGSLQWLVSDLHRQQEQDSINKDVFLFINIDADSFLWEPLSSSAWIQKIPNCGGLDGLIQEIKDLDFIVFDTPYGYLQAHAPSRTISFGEDVADGNFSGYASWAEKPFNRTIWTRLERARRMAAIQKKDAGSASFDERIRLLSTTHFGLASPVLNITREEKALQLSKTMVEKEMACFSEKKELTLHNDVPGTFFSLQLQCEKGFCQKISELTLEDPKIASYTMVPMSTYEDDSISSFYLLAKTRGPQEELVLPIQKKKAEEIPAVLPEELACGGLTVRIAKGSFPVFMKQGRPAFTLSSYLTYDGKHIPFGMPTVSPLPFSGSGRAVRYTGEIHCPQEEAAGWYQYDLVESDACNVLVMDCTVQYPYTTEKDSISTNASSLGRFSDHRWKEAVPCAFTFTMSDAVHLTKRNFMNSISDYPLADFWRSRKENENIASFNQQLTGGFLYLGDARDGYAIAHARMVSSSMAHCPMRLQKTGNMHAVTLNPFGTYFGPQRSYPTRGNGCVMDLYNMTMPQAQSLAPAYNGAKEQFLLGLVNAGPECSSPCIKELTCFADGVIASGGNDIHACTLDNSLAHAPRCSQAGNTKVKGMSSYSTSKTKLIGTVCRLLHQIHVAQRKAKQYLAKE